MYSFINKTKKLSQTFSEILNEPQFRKITKNYDFNGYRRIYLVHIRKTGGTSLNNMFLSLSGEDPDSIYIELAQNASHRLQRNDLVFVGWNKRLINRGNYFYAFSHIPLHKINLPKKTFTFTCFRDPIKRILSHYNMLHWHKQNNSNHPMMEKEADWLGKSFDDFLERIPQEHLLRQLYMFSSTFNVEEAVQNVNSLSYYFFLDGFSEGVEKINNLIDLKLKPIHIRRSSNKQVEINDDQIDKLKSMLANEYCFLYKLGWKYND